MPLCISKMSKMPKTLMKTNKCITGSHAFVHFENGQNSKNDLKPTNPKNAHKNEKNLTGQHASLYFENGPNAKNAHENEKNLYPGHMPLCISKMRRMPKTVEKH